AGHGNFIEAFQNDVKQVIAYEKDIMTGTILKLLYDDHDIRKRGFETIEEKKQFDIAVSNIPFGDFPIFDKGFIQEKHPDKLHSTKEIHNYFFVKALDKVREGGIVAFITSTGVMNSQSNQQVRE